MSLPSSRAVGSAVPGRWKGALPWIAAGLAGLLAALAFPLPGWSGLAWVSPGLLLLAALGTSPGAAFRLGWFSGLVQFLVSLRWLLAIPFPSGAVAAWLALSLYCALYPALWTVWATMWIRRWTAAPDGGPVPWVSAASTLAGLPTVRRSALWLGLGLGAAGLEVIRGRFLTGFPWNFWGITQWKNLPLIQIASVTGIFGVTALVHWVSLGIAGSVLQLIRSTRQRTSWMSDLRLPVLVLLLVLAWGVRRLAVPRTEGVPVSLALVQPSIPQTLIWDEGANPGRFGTVFALTRTALESRPDVLVWPEGSLPDITRDQFESVTRETAKAGATWVFGTGFGREVEGRPEHYNAALLVDAQGRVVDRYIKRRLVIFGEYIPLENTLPFMRWLTPIGSSFTAGTRAAAFPLGPGRTVVASPVICFEDMFPETTRDHVSDTTGFLLELTNNGWFGEGSAQWQHTAGAVFRAVENGVTLVRCANNGLTCRIDPTGRVADLFQKDGSVYGPGVLRIEVAGRPKDQGPTWYRLRGDVFGITCAVVAVLGISVELLQRRLRTRSGASASTRA
ncbi:MAG: apolipoprotein N-acyltransferase [Verrucomicrobia bacterium]|nr:apolipoprotein N-acyltransferase [Verrucomicrobiota bacterium]